MSDDVKRYMAWEIADCVQRFVSDPKSNPGIFVSASDHDRVVAELKGGNYAFSEQIANQHSNILGLKIELATARAQIAKLREQRDSWVNTKSISEDLDAELAALEPQQKKDGGK